MVRDAEHQPHVVVDQEDGRAIVDDGAEVATELGRLVHVETRRRLVETQQLRAGGERSGDGDQLALALGELGRRRLGEIAERQRREGLIDRIGARAPAGEQLPQGCRYRWVARGDVQVLAHGEIVEQLDRLPGAGEAPPHPGVRSGVGDVPTVQRDGPAVRDETGDRVDERRLSRTVRADQPDELARLDVEIDIDHGVHAPERHRHPASREDRAHERSSMIASERGSSGRRTARSGAAGSALRFCFATRLR